MKILIVDDVKETCNYIAQVISEQYHDFVCHTAFSYEMAIDLLNKDTYDVMILDYELDKSDSSKNGLALGKYISKSANHANIPVVFATSYPEHIYSVVNMLNCAYYMIKPFYKENILDMMNKVLSITPESIKLTFHNSVGIHTLINVSDIVYIHSARHNITVCTIDREYHFTNYSLSDIEKDSHGQLLRCHKSYLVNYDYLAEVDRTNNYIHLSYCANTVLIPVGRKYSEKIYNYGT